MAILSILRDSDVRLDKVNLINGLSFPAVDYFLALNVVIKFDSDREPTTSITPVEPQAILIASNYLIEN